MTTNNGKYVKRGQVLVIQDDPQRDREVAAANRHKVGAPFLYAEPLFTALAVVKSITGLPSSGHNNPITLRSVAG